MEGLELYPSGKPYGRSVLGQYSNSPGPGALQVLLVPPMLTDVCSTSAQAKMNNLKLWYFVCTRPCRLLEMKDSCAAVQGGYGTSAAYVTAKLLFSSPASTYTRINCMFSPLILCW
jgi:hypothetical protein